MDAIERLLRSKLQEFANRIDAESLIKEKLQELKENGEIKFSKIEL
jgi:hypothetical protein